MPSQGCGWYHLGAPEVRVRAVQVIKNAEDAEALVELKVMEVVRLVGGEEWEVVARVRVDGVHRDEGAPQPQCGHMRTENKGPGKNGQQVRHNVFQRMAIDGREGNRGSPFVMLLVNVFVYLLMVQHPVRVKKSDLLDDQKEHKF